MISAWELYLWTRLDVIGGVSIAVAVITSIIGGIILFINLSNCFGDWSEWQEKDDTGNPKYIKQFNGKTSIVSTNKITLPIAVFCVLFTILIPTKKDAAMIWIVPQLATVENAELLKGEAAEIYTLAKEALKESIGAKETE